MTYDSFSSCSGLYCDKTIDACDSAPCLNGGVCQGVAGARFQCNCSGSYTGKYCENLDLSPITSSPSGISAEEIYGIIGGFGVFSVCTLLWHCWRGWGLQSLSPSVALLARLGFTVFAPFYDSLVSLGFSVFVPCCDIYCEFGVYSHCICLCPLLWALLVSLGFTVFAPFYGIIGEFGFDSLCTLLWHCW